MPMTDAERNKRARKAVVIMFAVEIVAFLVFWGVQQFWHQPNLAFALLMIGVLTGAGYYIYEVRKLRVKE
jgi:Flp pilus assembly protein TadB